MRCSLLLPRYLFAFFFLFLLWRFEPIGGETVMQESCARFPRSQNIKYLAGGCFSRSLQEFFFVVWESTILIGLLFLSALRHPTVLILLVLCKRHVIRSILVLLHFNQGSYPFSLRAAARSPCPGALQLSLARSEKPENVCRLHERYILSAFSMSFI